MEPPTSPLTARAIERLQKLADGNGLAPDAIKLLGSEEKTWVLNATLELEPLAEAIPGRTPEAKKLNIQALPNFAALQSEIQNRQKSFREDGTWIPAAIKRLKDQPAQGWGLDDVRISLPEYSALLSASEACPGCRGAKTIMCEQCSGQGAVTCAQCQGARQEYCYNCAGRGTNPVDPNQPCAICNGRRYIPCRMCHGSGMTTCPVCQGRRGVTCPTCNGVGAATQEVTLSCGARTHFIIAPNSELPTGLRRGLDRLGFANLVNGYADIETTAPPVDKDNPPPPPVPGLSPDATQAKPKTQKAELHYMAKLPYADMRISFNGKAAVVGAFGKRGSLIGVPAFLDAALEPWREKLRAAASGKGSIDETLDARVLHDAFALQLGGTNDVRALRKLYPIGLSNEAAQDIMTNMRLALNKITLHARAAVAAACVTASAAFFGVLFFTSLNARLTQNLLPAAG